MDHLLPSESADPTVLRIRALLGSADKDQARESTRRWEAAHLIHTRLQEPDLSKSELAREIGTSPTHVRRMARCWQQFVIDKGRRFAPGEEIFLEDFANGVFMDYSQLGSFTDAYQSELVRCDPDEPKRREPAPRQRPGGHDGPPDGRSRPERPDPTGGEDLSARGRVAIAAREIAALTTQRAYHDFLSELDADLAALSDDIARLRRLAKRRSRPAA